MHTIQHNNFRRRLLRGAVATACAACLLPAAQAQADKWPTRSVTIVSPYNPGATTSLVPPGL